MPKKTFTEEDVRKIAAKYIFDVRRDVGGIPDIRKVIVEAMKNVAPDRDIDDADVSRIITSLSKRPTITNQIIAEAAKEVVDHSANEDLKFLISRNLRALGKKPNAKDIADIIKFGKLNPYSSTLAQIRDAVKNFFNRKPLEQYTPVEIRDRIKEALSKYGPVDDRDIKTVFQNYMKTADQDKPLNSDEIEDVIKKHIAVKSGKVVQTPATPTQPSPIEEPTSGPQPSPISRGRGKRETKHDVKAGNWVPPKDGRNLSFFEKIRLRMFRYGKMALSKEARNWLKKHVNEVSRSPSRKKIITEGQTVAEAIIGKMFLYFYDAKTKKELPYWDKFPLIFVLEMYDDGWLGINLHYLPIDLRIKLFDKLLQFANDKSLDKIKKLRLSYSLLKNFSQFPEVKPCIKRYLSSYVKSDLLPISAFDWEIAIFLPVEQFQKETKEYVWGESRKKIRQLRRR